jgi:hypothetical protein
MRWRDMTGTQIPGSPLPPGRALQCGVTDASVIHNCWLVAGTRAETRRTGASLLRELAAGTNTHVSALACTC